MTAVQQQDIYIRDSITDLLNRGILVVSCRDIFRTPHGVACLATDGKALMRYALNSGDSRISLIIPYQKAPVTGGLLYRLTPATVNGGDEGNVNGEDEGNVNGGDEGNVL